MKIKITLTRQKLTLPVKLCLCLVTCLTAQSLHGQTFSSVAGHGIPPLTNSKAEWADFNADGKLDLFISGTNGSGGLQTSVFINNGDNTFNSIPLTPLADIAFDLTDYNDDGFVDIVTTGINASAVKKTLVYKNTNGTAFVSQSFSLTNLSKGSVLWEDLDQDTDADLLLTGINASNEETTLLYEFKEGIYVLKSHNLPAVSNGEIKAFDADKDGHTEVLITGLGTDGVPIAKVYSFNSDLSTELYTETLTGTAFNSVVNTDADDDGFDDIFLAGLSGESLEKNTVILKNNATNNFTDISNGFTEVSSASVNASDLNNDGRADLIVTGIDDDGFKHFHYYRNDEDLEFTDIAHAMPNIYNGDAALADYDNDGDIDIFQIGNSDISFQANLYTSDQSSTVANAPPGVPTNLEAIVVNDSVFLSWDAVADDLTNANSLTYNVYISSDPNGVDLIVAPLSNLTSGLRYVTKDGNAGHKLFKAFHGLPEGRFSWSVQAIDNGFQASDFATEASFAICYPFSLGMDTVICQDGEISLSTGEDGDEVNWYSLTSGLLVADNRDIEHTITQNDTIVAEIIKPFTCTVTDTIIVRMSTPPDVNLGLDIEVCEGQEFSTSVSNSIDSVNWYNPSGILSQNTFTYEYIVTVRDTIIGEFYNAYECVSYDSIIVDVLSLPQFSAGQDRSICFGESTLLEVTGSWEEVNWSSLQVGSLAINSPTHEFEVLEKDTIVASVKDVNGCINYDSAVVDVLPLPVISLGPDQSVCDLDNAHLTLSGSGTSVKWFDKDANLLATGSNSYSYQVLQTRETIVEVIDADNCVSYDSITISLLPLPQFNVGVDTAICFNNNILLEAGAGFQRVDWISLPDADTLNAGSWFFDYHVEATDTLVAIVEHANGCLNYDSISVVALQLPIIDLGADVGVCYNDTARLEVVGNWDEVNWYTLGDLILEADAQTYTYVVEESLTIWTEVFDQHRCVSYDTINVNLLSLPEFDLGEEKAFCKGDEIHLEVADGAFSYEWKDQEGSVVSSTHEFISTALFSGELHLTVTDEFDCQFNDDVVVTVHALPDFTIEGDSSICANDVVNLHVSYSGVQSITWVDQVTNEIVSNDTLSKTLTAPKTYAVTLIDNNDCENTLDLNVQVFERPVVDAGEDQLICFGESVVIGTVAENNDFSYQWSPSIGLDNAASARPTAAPSETVTYALTVTSGENCASTDSVYIEVNPQIVVDAGSDISICIGDSLQIGGVPTASGSAFPYIYEWLAEDASISDDANPTVSPLVTTRYFILVSSGKCSVEIDSIEVTVNALPSVTISEDQSIGAGSSVTLEASGGIAFAWSPSEKLNDAASASPVASPLKTIKYTVTVTDVNLCADTASVTVFVQNNLFIPNVFSPNGDERNDVFKLYGSGVEKITLSIFDQKGNEIFRSSDKEVVFGSGWDGSENGKQLKDDVYIWTIDGSFYSGEKVVFEGKDSGIIKLMR